MEISNQQIVELRENFLKKLANESDETETLKMAVAETRIGNNKYTEFIKVHPADLDRVKTSDHWLKRFLLHHEGDQSEALKMLWDTCEWRKSFGANDISENNVRSEILEAGAFFSHGKDIDGATLFIFKCKLHVKGQRNFEDLKRCVVYWFERLEREVNGESITIFFDMDGCGLSNMDLEFTKYLINLFKLYYPYFLNYIIIYEMAWILNAAFKIIKALLPEKAVAKMKFLSKSSVKDYVPLKHALKSWGGEDEYVFSFVPENRAAYQTNAVANNKKVHFADGSPMSENAAYLDKEQGDEILAVSPSTFISFVKEGTDLSSTVTLRNVDEKTIVAYKMKTTAPEKFRVRPSTGCLAPGAQETVIVTLIPGYQLGGLSRDKFLIMSTPVESSEMSPVELAEFWKSMSGKNVSQHKLRCAQPASETTKNGSVVNATVPDSEQTQIVKLTSRISQLSECQGQLHKAVKHIQIIQLLTIVLIVILGIGLMYVMQKDSREDIPVQHCYKEA